jgi:hypothetical protein
MFQSVTAPAAEQDAGAAWFDRRPGVHAVTVCTASRREVTLRKNPAVL